MKKTWTEIIDGKEVKFVDNAWYEFEYEKIRYELVVFCGGYQNCHVELFEKAHSFYTQYESTEMQVNWSAIGTVSIEEAEDFVSQLHKAIELAATFKYNGYVRRYGHEYTDEEKQEIMQAYQEAGMK